MTLNVVEKYLVESLQEEKYKKILIWSCHNGRLGEVIREHVNSDVYLVGVEESEQYIEDANQYLDKVIHQALNQFSLPSEETFDCIIYNDIHYYLTDPIYNLDKNLSLLNRGGDLFFTFFNSQHYKQIQDLVRYGLSNQLFLFGGVSKQFFNLDFFKFVMDQLSLPIIDIMGLSEDLYFMWHEIKPNIKMGTLGQLKIQNQLQLFNFLSIYYLIKVSYKDKDKAIRKPRIRAQSYSMDDLQAILYKDLTDYWKQSGKYYYFAQAPYLYDGNPQQAETTYYANLLAELKPKKVLEVGCGYGRNLKELKKVYPDCEIYGIDISTTQLENARDYLEEEEPHLFQYEEGQKLPFDDNSFDLVFTSGVLCIMYPEVVDEICTDMLRVSSKYVVHNEDMKVEDFRFFVHDYIAIYNNKPAKVVEVERNPHFTTYQVTTVEKKR